MITVLAPMFWGFALACVLVGVPLVCAWQRERAARNTAEVERAAAWSFARAIGEMEGRMPAQRAAAIVARFHPVPAASASHRFIRPAAHRPRGRDATTFCLPVPLRRRMPPLSS